MTWREFDQEFAMAMEELAERRERFMGLVEALGDGMDADNRRAFGREVRFWDRFVAALRWAVAEFEREYELEEPSWKFLELADIAPYQQVRRQLRLAEVYQEWGHERIRRLYGATV